MNREYRISYGRVDQSGMSDTEKRHLGIALGALTLAFAFSFTGGYVYFDLSTFPFYLGLSFLSVTTAFIFHEFAHRKLARDYGCWAEFRMWRWGLMLAVMFGFLFGWVFAAPGSVMIQGRITKEQHGKISAVGPGTNWAVGTGFLIASLVLFNIGMGFIGALLGFVSYVNLFIGGFNLLPFGPLDGRKIFSWSAKHYIALVGLIGSSLAAGFFTQAFSFII
ncbi:MAG: hypothetical protein ACOCSL_01105 [Thermoplasmatota archaeon]